MADTPNKVVVKEVEIAPFDIIELTDTTFDGIGVLDKLLTTLRTNLNHEYDEGRITGHEYSQVFTDLYQATLTGAISFTMARHKLAIELENLEKDGKLTDAQIHKIEEELKKVPVEIEHITAQTEQVKYNTTTVLPAEVEQTKAQTQLVVTQKDNLIQQMTKIPVEIEVMQAQKKQIGSETVLTETRTQQVTAELAKIPVEVEILRKQSVQADAETELTNKRIEQVTLELTKTPLEVQLLGQNIERAKAEVKQTEASTDRISKETELKLPVEVANLTKQGDNLDAQTILTTNQGKLTDAQATKIPVDIEYTRAQIANMGKQTLILEKDYEIKQGQLAIQEKQLLLSEKELMLKDKEIALQAASVLTQQAQAELYTQKVVTEKAQTQGGVAQPNSVIDMNNKVLNGQIEGYKRDAEQKAAKIFLDSWITSYQGGDREANSVNRLFDPNVGEVILKLMAGIQAQPQSG